MGVTRYLQYLDCPSKANCFRLLNVIFTYMKLTIRLIFAFLVLILIPLLCQASPVYYLITGQANANTTIDSGHEMEWSAPSLTPSCFDANCSTYPITQLDSKFDWIMGGRRFM